MNIELKNVTKTFKDTVALDNIDLTFAPNKIVGLLGKNGAGKTTMLNAISARLFVDAGDITLDGEIIVENDTLLSQLYVMGDKMLYPESMRVKEVIKWSQTFYSNFDVDFCNHLVNLFKLPLKSKVKNLSTGYSTILKDIIALCVNTPFVFFDEPVLGLDAHHREVFYKALLESFNKNESSYVVSTHLIDEISNIVEDVIIIDSGQILYNTTCEALRQLGYAVTGEINAVNTYIIGKEVISDETLGNLKVAYVLGDVDDSKLNAQLTVSNIDLQKLFIELTKREAV